MARMFRLLFVLCIASLAACAQMGVTGGEAANELDQVKIAKVERDAKLENRLVFWVNFPRRTGPMQTRE